MYYYAISALVNAITSTILGFLVLARKNRSKANKLFSLFCFTVALWSYNYYFWQRSDDAQSALLYARLFMGFAIFIPFFYFHFILILLNKIKEKKNLLALGYLFGIVFLIFDFTPWFIKGVVPKLDFPFWPVPGIAYHIFLIGWFGYVIYSTYLLYKFYKNSLGIARQQLVYLLFGVVVGYVGGATNYFLWYNIPIPPVGNIFVTAFVGLTAYAILRYRLMDIHLIWKNLIVYSGMLVYTFFMYHAGTGLVMRVIGSLYSNSAMMMEIPLIIFYVISMIKISEELTEVSEKRLFGSFFLYQQKLRELTQDLTTVIDFDALTQKIVKGIMDIMRVERAGLLLKENGGRDHYKIQHVVGFYEENGISLVKDNFLTEYLGKTQKAIVYEELQFIIRDTFDEEKKTRLKKLLDNMKSIEAELCVPLFSKNVLEGIIVLGPKQTGEAYNQAELDLLETLASQAAIAIENAALYEKVQDLNENLEVKVKEQTKTLEDQNVRLKGLLELKSEFLHIVSHQLRTPLTTLRGFLQFWKSGEFKQFPEDQQKDMQERIYNSSERLNTLINDMLTAMDLEGGAFHFTFGTVDVKEIIRAIYEELKDYFAEKQLEFRFAPPEDDRKIMGDPRYLREALLNIIDNAQKYTPSGFVEAAIENGENTVIIKIHDSGMGISERDQARIFNKFIRGERAEELIPNGTGLGLYIAKQIIEGHKGTVTMDSPGEGQGATATITLPIIQ